MSAEYIPISSDGLRNAFKKETGLRYGSPVNDQRNPQHLFSDEYVEWLEEKLCNIENTARLTNSLLATRNGGVT